jgi:hypothetical protein
LGVDPKAADSYLRELKTLQLVDDDGKPTDLAKQWRDDTKYPEVCKEIREHVYPSELLSVAPPPDPGRDSVIKWFMHGAGLGQGAAQNKASPYLLLAAGNPGAEGAPRERSTSDARKTRPQITKPSARSIPANAGASAGASTNGSTGVRTPIPPDIHLNFQIHISPQSTAEQIEAIFASMAKHLRISGS